MAPANRRPRPNPARAGTCLVPLGHRRFALIDARDAAAVARHTWSCWIDPDARTTKYAVTYVRGADGRRRRIRLHLFLWWHWRRRPAQIVDHRNTDGLDCTRRNLRRATHAQNNRNQPLRSDNTSGCKGVSWDKRRRRWRVQVQKDGTRIVLGTFRRKREAISCRQRGARRLHGRFARSA